MSSILKVQNIQYTDGDAALTIADGGGVTAASTLTSTGNLIANGSIGLGTTNPGHNLEIKKAAPEIMLEETSSGGSKRLSLGVDNAGLPFINAEQSGGQIAFHMTGTEVARFKSTGLAFPNNSNIGIDFSASADGGNGSNRHEILFDYEQGQWTPTLTYGGTVSNNWSWYVKIGSLVWAGCYVNFSGIPNNSDGFYIGGLPFPVMGNSAYFGTGAITFVNTFNWNGTGALSGPTPHSAQSQVYFHRGDGTAAVVLNSAVQGLAAFIFAVTYATSY